MRKLLVVLLAAALTIPAALSAQSEATTEDEIRAVVEGYVVGWREGDLERLGEVFDPDGHVYWLSGSGDEQALGSMTFAQVIARGSRPNPEYGLEWEILALDVVDDQLASTKLHITHAGGSYVDVLLLQKIHGQWRIVTKTFVSR